MTEQVSLQIETKLLYLLSISDSFLFQVDKNGVYTLFEKGASEIQIDPSQIIGRSIYELHKDHPQVIENIENALAGKHFRCDVSIDGYTHDVIYSPIMDSDDKIIGAYGVAMNITDRRKTEIALAQSEKKYKDLYNHMVMGYSSYKIITDEANNPVDYIIIEVNSAYEKITGLSRESIVGKKGTEAFPNIKNSSVDWIGLFGEVALTGKTVSMEVYSDIMDRWYSVYYFCPEHGYVSSIFSDITNRVVIERELEFQRKLSEIIIENIPDALSIYDKEGNLVLTNLAGRRLYQEDRRNILDNEHNKFRFFDLDGNEISPEEIPTRRALRGETVNREIVVIKMPDKEQITEVSAVPIFQDHEVKYSITLHRDITETIKNQNLIKSQQIEILEKEKEKNAALEQALKMKDEFISLISHELKTPLSVIIAALQTMELVCGSELPEKSVKYLEKIKQNSNRQLKLINNLLDCTRAGSAYFKINKKNIDIILLTKKIIESISAYAEKKGIQVLFETAMEKKIIGVDEELYERILLNLLSNAVKFTPGKSGKSITVVVAEQKNGKGDKISVRVTDEGIGIPEDKIPLIFERFCQIDNIFSRTEEGTGIGLSLVKMLTEMMGGEIRLESKEGVGSSFTIILPVEESEEDKAIGPKTEDRLLQTTAIEFSDMYLNT